MSYARTAVTRMTLDMRRPDLQRSETVTLGDTNRRWEVTLINGGAPFRLPPNWTAALTGIKPDGTGLLNGCSIADGKIIYDFAAGAEIATCAGNFPVQFDIWDEVGDLVASPKIYVNVLADVRPHEGMKSESEYGLLGEFIAQKNELIADVTSNTNQIGDLIGRVNQTDADVDLLGETALAQGVNIAALKEKVTTAGSVTIPASEWTDTLPKLAFPEQPVLDKGTVALLIPSNIDSQKAARKAKITIQSETYGGGKIIIQREDGEAPTGNILLDYIIIKVDNPEAPPKAALIGVDAYGEGGGTAGGVDEDAVKKIINSMLGNVDNVRQYSADNPPPYPVTSVNDQTGAVKLTIPSKAADIGAATPETVNSKIKTHNTDNAAHEYIQQRIDALRTMVENFLDVDNETADQLSEVLQDIKDNADALTVLGTKKIDKTSISNSLTDSSPDHVPSMALITQLDQMIDDLDAGKTTPAQVAATLKTELASYIKTTDIVNDLTSTDTDKPLSAKQGKVLNDLIDLIDAGKITSDEANDLITNALELYTPTDELPSVLPTPHKLIINGVEFDGSKEVSLQLDDVELVESLAQMTDTSKYYGIRNAEDKADIWWYVYRKGHTNWLPIAYTLPADQTPLEGVGYKMNWRVDGKNGEEGIPPDGLSYLTGYIPIHAGSVITCENIKMDSATYGCLAAFYDASGTILAGKHVSYGGSYIVDNEYNGITITVPPTYTTAAYIRIQGYYEYKKTPELNTATIVVDEAITDYETGWQWEDSGVDTSFGNDTALLELTKRVTAAENEINEIKIKLASSLSVPEYWQDHIAAKIAEIQSAQAAARQRCVTWATVTDIHDDSSAGGTGRLLKAVCDQCGINAVLCLGDYSTRSTKATADRCRQSMGNSNNILAPVADRLLGVRGNHDGGYKTSDAYLLKPSEVDSIIQYPMATDLEITYDAVGSGYYATDKAHKVRYIMLNTDHRGANPDSTVASDGSSSYPYMSFYRYTQVQMDMVKEALTTIPNDSWTVIVASHVPPIGSVDRYGDGSFVVDLSIRLEDYLAMRNLLNAYVNRTTATVSFSGSATWDQISLSVDFTAAKGHLAEYQSGHLHRYLYFDADHIDPKSNTALGFPIRAIRSDGFNENHDDTNDSELDDEYAAQRVPGTTTEHSFVVCVHNIDTRETTCIHVGAQEE